nr:hypothetical protein Iba_chr10cCG4940 [Ipomoea batatas]
MLKWKSQEMTKANTIQAKRKFRNQCPFRQFRVSGAEDVGTANTAFVAKSREAISQHISCICIMHTQDGITLWNINSTWQLLLSREFPFKHNAYEQLPNHLYKNTPTQWRPQTQGQGSANSSGKSYNLYLISPNAPCFHQPHPPNPPSNQTRPQTRLSGTPTPPLSQAQTHQPWNITGNGKTPRRHRRNKGSPLPPPHWHRILNPPHGSSLLAPLQGPRVKR